MKKALLPLALLACSAICGCGTPKPKAVDPPAADRPDVPGSRYAGDTIEIEISGPYGGARKYAFPGVVRRAGLGPAGTYSLEYVHMPDGKRDDTVDYSLELRADSTYGLHVVTDGVEANHTGRWYAHRNGEIVMFYDEQKDVPAHNIYAADCLYAEILAGGKLMIFDNGNVIVLAKNE